jgi:acyl-CoA oxidase
VSTVAPPLVPSVDVGEVAALLAGRWGEIRATTRDLMAEERFHRPDGLTVAEHRARVLEQLRVLVAQGGVHRAYPEALGGGDDHGGNVAGFEELVLGDPSVQVKAGVQWGLFGAAILHLGTADHHARLLPPIMSLEVPGCFAMTETGHGSDVARITTTATYDPTTEEFDLHTPERAAWKDYIGNAALHGTAAVVFARLRTLGQDHGVHAFYVPLRDTAAGAGPGEPLPFLPGVGGQDNGPKGGLEGVDNGRLHFHHVRVPRVDLLDRYGSVAPDGTYSSPIAHAGRRFFTMLGTLVQGRVSLDGAAVRAGELALTIAVTYANRRRQFTGPSEDEEVLLLDYQEHQRRLLPRLAVTYAQHLAHEGLLELFDGVFSGRSDGGDAREDLETLAAALKPLSTWHAIDTIQAAREACGGAGFLAENRLVGLRADLDVYVTFEGDNTVLLQLVAKRLLADYAEDFAKIDASGLARYAASRAADTALYRTPLLRWAQAIADTGSVRRAVGRVRAPETQRELLRGRAEAMVAELAGSLRLATKVPRERAAVMFNARQHELVAAARAHAEALQWEAFTAALSRVEDPGTLRVLTWLRDLFGLTLLERDIGWYLLNGRLSAGRARAVTSSVDRLLTRLRPHAQDLVDAFGFRPEHVRAPIAL